MYLYLYVSYVCMVFSWPNIDCKHRSLERVPLRCYFQFGLCTASWNVMINWSYIVESTLEACSWHLQLYVDLQFDHLKIKSVATFIFFTSLCSVKYFFRRIVFHSIARSDKISDLLIFRQNKIFNSSQENNLQMKITNLR